MLRNLILFTIFAYVTAQREYPVFSRTCDTRKRELLQHVKTAFSVIQYSGSWFEIERYQQENEPEADCLASQYTWGPITNSFQIRRTGLELDTRAIFNRTATALLAFPDESPRRGILNVTYYADREADGSNYYILGTDYFQYVVGWACEDLSASQSREFAWVLSRTPDLPASYRARVDDYIDRLLHRRFFRTTEQSNQLCGFHDPDTREARMEYETRKKLNLLKEV